MESACEIMRPNVDTATPGMERCVSCDASLSGPYCSRCGERALEPDDQRQTRTRLRAIVLPRRNGIDTDDPAYSSVADRDGQTTVACEAGVDVGGDPIGAGGPGHKIRRLATRCTVIVGAFVARAACACCNSGGSAWNARLPISMGPGGCAAFTSVATRTSASAC